MRVSRRDLVQRGETQQAGWAAARGRVVAQDCSGNDNVDEPLFLRLKVRLKGSAGAHVVPGPRSQRPQRRDDCVVLCRRLSGGRL